MPDSDRRPNPQGWIPPKAPYNPYDPTDIRPAEGYPSEFKIPGQEPQGFSSIPKTPTQYQKINETMKKLNYTPRPKSSVYPGQYMVLRRIDTNQRLNTGTRWFGSFLTGSIVVYFAFFYKWNDGHENVLSDFYRYRLLIKEKLVGLSETEYDDLYYPKKANIHLRNVRDAEYIPESMRLTKEGDFALNRPSEKHVLEAQRLQQEQEEELLRQLDKHRDYAQKFIGDKTVKLRSKWWWF